ncbi:MAG: iron chelate uptake ABC transporter family permease subunit [Bifidobacterium aquikefiri]|uniref:ABC transporter permease n=1 Tax=Bifidobacterium aquikefiri TaxID=1653207 RepID=A0A261GD02_9BIFI|nr:iron chelate uptake ABC transporter family permease subunit [Bifidobacterium aquikefiri]OZG68856.1 ABC transporter permease [Bifidobacterium aquikefiri]
MNQTNDEKSVALRASFKRAVMVIVSLFILALVLLYIDIIFGDSLYSFTDVMDVIASRAPSGITFVIGELRLPRALTAFACGALFGMAGASFQRLLHNPLASPDIIGITEGANTAAVFGIVVLGISGLELSAFAIVGGLTTAIVVALLTFHHGFAPQRLVLVGIAIGAMLNAIGSWMLIRADQWDIQSASRWLTGSLADSDWTYVIITMITLAIGLIAVMPLSRQLDMLRLGDDVAAGLGVKVGLSRAAIVIIAVLMLSIATSAVGPIAFVSFLAGPIAVRLIHSGSSAIATSGLVGSCLVLGSDVIAQHATGTQFPVGVVTSVIGGPVLVVLMYFSMRKESQL